MQAAECPWLSFRQAGLTFFTCWRVMGQDGKSMSAVNNRDSPWFCSESATGSRASLAQRPGFTPVHSRRRGEGLASDTACVSFRRHRTCSCLGFGR